ncbi:DUF4112 domain-containing protein [Terracidiphilus sp.]|uniref:DUF4112 domain-containing protein n=1 Tax=Terracidiphilus sp. TaxID=1964191 RepID=UPI003C1A713A
MPNYPSKLPEPLQTPVILPPASGRWGRGAWLFRDETLRQLEVLLDEAFRIPGTNFRFGIDGIIGLIPGLGDVLAGLLSLIIPIAAWIRGVPYVTLFRMAVNIAIGVLVGAIPLFGDIFDVAWKANRRNYLLLQRHLHEPRMHTWRDWCFLLLLLCALGVVFAIPILVVAWLFALLFEGLHPAAVAVFHVTINSSVGA